MTSGGGMFTIMRRTAGLWWRTWPLVTAIYLTGWLLRYWLLQLAIEVGTRHGNLWAYLILPLAPLARLLAYLAIFLVFRSVTPALRHSDMKTPGSRRLVDIVLGAIVPFLVLYTTWKLIEEDYFVYQTSVQYRVLYESTKEGLADFLGSDTGVRLWALVAVAFALRQLITRLRDRLPRWSPIVAAYLDTLWLFLTLTTAAKAVLGSPRWISERRLVVWASDLKQDVVAQFALVGYVWDGAGVVLGALVSVGGLSLAWVALASVVYGTPFTPTWDGARRAMLGQRGSERLTGVVQRSQRVVAPRWQRLPGLVRGRVIEAVREQFSRFGPIVDAGRLILHGGLVPIAFFIAGYAALTLLSPSGAFFSGSVTDGYLWRAVGLALGPHEWMWWATYRDTIRIAIGALVDPVRVALVTATFWYCVDRIRAEDVGADSPRVESDDPAA